MTRRLPKRHDNVSILKFVGCMSVEIKSVNHRGKDLLDALGSLSVFVNVDSVNLYAGVVVWMPWTGSMPLNTNEDTYLNVTKCTLS